MNVKERVLLSTRANNGNVVASQNYLGQNPFSAPLYFVARRGRQAKLLKILLF